MMICADNIFQEQLARSMGLDKYERLMNEANRTDVSRNPDFQRTFNAFYLIRRNEEWRKVYYKLFEYAKIRHSSFAEVIRILYEKTGNVEASFSSKMIATINPDKPIWDQYVLINLGLKLKGKNAEERLEHAIIIYEQIEQWYKDYLLTEEARKNIAVFDQKLPSYKWLSEVKKIDCLLWSKR